MDARPRPDARDDAELVRAATAGDRGAFAAIYDRYADRLHDFCWSVLRDRDEAADATQDAFLVAAERLGQLRDPERLRPWLYAVARSQALRRVRARSRVAPEEEMTELPDPATGPEQAAERSDLRELVWNAAAGLSERDRALLDLHLRHGLEGAELGQAMGVEPGHAYVLLSRLRDQVERSLGALLVARLGRDDCPDLAAILSGWDGRFTPLIRKRVARHVDACDVCGERRRTAASPLALLAAVPPMPAPAFLRDRVLERVELVSGSASGGGAGGPGQGGGPPVAASVGAPQPEPPAAGPPEGERSRLGGSGGSGIHSPRRRGAVVALVAALLLAVGVGVGLGWERAPASSPTNGQGGPIVAGAATSVAPTSPPTTAAPSSTTSSSTSVTTTTAAPSPPSLAVTPARVALGAAGATASLTVRNGGDEPLSWTADPSTAWLRVSPSTGRLDGGDQATVTLSATRDGLPEGDADGRVELTWGGPARSVAVALRVERRPEIGGLSTQFREIFIGRCTPTTTRVDATVTDESAISSVTMRWAGGSVPMTLRGGRWSASLGPATSPGSVPWQVIATDARGNTASASGPAVTASPCP
ncbi:MAG TPA: sigma-70 family RNA polymerase sigma factor [Actinomycetes bacterium]|nr:sigma-70 family RNA polymerase sigma factor [Actinomycetes bacterium]